MKWGQAIPNAPSGSMRLRPGCRRAVWPMLCSDEAPLAAIGDIELAHDRMLVAAIRGLSEQLADDVLAGGPSHAQIDPDTSMNVHTGGNPGARWLLCLANSTAGRYSRCRHRRDIWATRE